MVSLSGSFDTMRMSKEVQAKRTNDALANGKVASAVSQAPLIAQMHTPFNARELMWNAYGVQK
jgi:hypothetical protein